MKHDCLGTFAILYLSLSGETSPDKDKYKYRNPLLAAWLPSCSTLHRSAEQVPVSSTMDCNSCITVSEWKRAFAWTSLCA